MEPRQRTQKFVRPIEAAGGVVVQLKLTVASVRTRVGRVENDTLVKATLVTLDQYDPCSPVPVPMAELSTNPTLATPLLTAPGWAAIACTLALVVKMKGPV